MNGLKLVYECIRIKQKKYIEMYNIAEKFVLNGNVSLCLLKIFIILYFIPF